MTTSRRAVLGRAGLLLLLVAGAGGLCDARAAEDAFITEFMAANARTIMDRDRDFSDWIELHNAGTAPLNLRGWYLTDKKDRLTRWEFPDTTIAPAGYLVVFASGKDRRVPGQELHTNFKLAAGGGYLALVKPDGRTIASQFAPNYPAQTPDVSYGISLADPTRVLVGRNANGRMLVPTQPLDSRWTQPGFDDSKWSEGRGGVGFDSANEFAGLLGTNVRAPMLGHNASVFLRLPFAVEDANWDDLRLQMRYTDGFVAYLNGTEIARREVPPEVRWNSQATTTQRPATPVVLLAENFEASPAAYTLSETSPKMRPRVHPVRAGAPGQFLRLVNGQEDRQANSILWERGIDSGSEPIIVDFDFRFKNVADAPGRLSLLLLPARAYPARGGGIALRSYADKPHAEFPGAFAVEFRPGHSKRTVCLHSGLSGRDDNEPVSGHINLLKREFHHAQVQLKPTGLGTLVTVSLSPGRNGKQVAIPEVLVPGLNLGPCRLQFAAQIGTWDNTVDLANLRAQTAEGATLRSEEFDLARYRSVLRPGNNVLAVQGLNRAAEDQAFLVAPELLGRPSNGPKIEPGYFAQPTPRAANKKGFNHVAPAPAFSRNGGVLTENLLLELKVPSGTIHYTLDGSEPTVNSAAYTAPVRVTESMLIKARTFEEGAVPSPVATQSYTVVDEALAKSFSSKLPLVVINTHGRYVRHGSRTLGYLTVLEGGQRTSLGAPVDFYGPGEMNVRGFSSLRQPKHSYTFRAREDSGGKLKAPILGMPKHSDWVLFAPYSDKTLMRDVLAYDLSRQMGRYAARARFVEVFLAGRGGKVTQRDYLGVYALMEKIERGKGRVDIEELTPSDNAEPAISGGYIFKRDHSDDERPDFYTSRGSGMFFIEPNSRDVTREQRAWIARYMNEVERAIYGPHFRDPATGYAQYLDVDAFIDQHWLIEMSKNIDGFRYSVFFTKDRGGKLQVQPAWDWNLSFGNANYHDGWDPTDWYTDRLRSSEICWFRRLNQDPEFAQRAIDRWGELRRDAFALPNIFRRIDELAALLDEAQVRNFQRWRIMGRDVWPNYYVGKSYEDEVAWMKKWIRQRIEWIDSRLPAMPVIVPPGRRGQSASALTLQSRRGRIYYTLDGTDPRQPGGAVAPAAQIYKSPIPLNSHATVVARAQDGSGWSAPLAVKPSSGSNASD